MAAWGQFSGPAASGGAPKDSRLALGVLDALLGSLLLGALVAPSGLAALDIRAVSVGVGLTLVDVLMHRGAGVLGELGNGSTTASTARPITHV